jgi:DNA (cytosine-5)-methyltransferase 1
MSTKPQIILVDLFSGIGGFAKGLEDAGFEIVHHFFSEVDKHAIANYRYNFKKAEYVGSVTDVSRIAKRVGECVGEYPTARLFITFGSPCQDFSLAGKRSGMEGERSSLILCAVQLIERLRPHVYIWENVKGAYSSNAGADYWAIQKAFANLNGYGQEQQLVNTAWVLPQNRERIYAIGHLANRSRPGVFPFRKDDSVFDLTHQSRQRRSQTKHCSTIVRPGMGSKADDTFIATALNASSTKMVASDTYIQVKSATTKGYETATEGDSINLAQPNSETRRGRVGKGKAQTLETSRNQAVIHNTNMSGQTFENDHAGTLRGSASANYQLVNGIRRLTENECERLQGFPDDWTKYGLFEKRKVKHIPKSGTVEFHEPELELKEISRTQRYKMCGNAVTKTMVQRIGERLITNSLIS